MKVKKLIVQSYGPLEGLNLDFKGGLDIVFGPNGSGKTLAIESFQKLLLGRKKAKGLKSQKLEEFPLGRVVMDDGTREMRFTGKDSIGDSKNIIVEDLENIFVIKDGCLEIADADDFYRQTIPRLIGLDVSDIETVMEQLLELGRMTSSGNLSNQKQHGKPKKQLEDAKKLVAEICEFTSESTVREKADVELEIARFKHQKSDLQEKQNQLEQARKVRELRRLDGHLQKGLGFQNQLEELEIPELQELERQRLDFITKRKNNEYYEQQMKKWRYAALFSLIAAVSTAFVMLLLPGFYFIPLAGFLASFLCFFQERNTHREMYAEKCKEREILLTAGALSLPSESFEEFESQVIRIKIERENLLKEIDRKKAILEDHLPESARKAFTFESFSHYLREQMKSLDMTLDLEYDEDEFERGMRRIQELDEGIETLQEEREDFTKTLQRFESRIGDFAFDKILNRSFKSPIRSIESLEDFVELLKGLAERIELDKKISEEVYDILDGIYRAETEKIAKYLNEETEISALATRITSGFFKKIWYDMDTGTFLLQRGSGSVQNVHQLSRAELSQLYLAIRLALGTRCMEQGFLMMEDPFLASDDERFREQLIILRNFVEEGWQVIIFTAKNDLKAELVQSGGTLIRELQRIS